MKKAPVAVCNRGLQPVLKNRAARAARFSGHTQLGLTPSDFTVGMFRYESIGRPFAA